MRRQILFVTALAVSALRCGGDGDHRTLAVLNQRGDAGGFFNVVPPGQDGVLSLTEILAAEGGSPPAHFADQLSMYEGLVYQDATPGMTAAKLLRFYKDASFDVPDGDIERSYHPGGRDDVVVRRDRRFGVPHIFGTTREGTMFGQGYTAAEDRLFLMDALRHVGRAELAAFLGASPGNLAMDAEQLSVAPYLESDLTRQIEAIRTSGPEGQQVFADGTAYVAGVNQYIGEALLDPSKLPGEYLALQVLPSRFVPEDIVSIASLVGGIFGRGGGREVANFCGLDSMAVSLGASAAREVFDDFKLADDPEAPTTVPTEKFPYLSDLGPVDPAAIPDIDCASLKPISAGQPDPVAGLGSILNLIPSLPFPSPSSLLGLPIGMSNALLVRGDRTDDGRPIAVFGPQTAYFTPQLLVEKDVHGPGIDARGVAFAGTDLYVQLGHGPRYAWSATSAGADNVDQFVLRLCDPAGGAATVDSMGYLHHGTCKPIESVSETLLAKPSAGGIPADPTRIFVVKHFERSADYGPISARGKTKGGTPIAIATRRSTYMAELSSALGFLQVNDPGFMAGGFESFQKAFAEGVDYTFNWFYVDADTIGYQHSCKCPARARGVDPYLPAWGTGEFDWKGFLPPSAQPTVHNPDQGFIISWNNKQAKGFRTSDGEFGYGPVHRSLMLQRRLEAAFEEGKVDVGKAVDVMALAGTTDLRAQELLPLILEVLGPAAPPGVDVRAEEMRNRLEAWSADDLGHRRDHDHDGAYDDPQAPAILDAYWNRLVDRMFAAGSADAVGRLGFGIHDAPQGHVGSSFLGGVYSQVQKDLRQVLGRTVAGAFSRTYCGGGNLASCRLALWEALGEAAADLENEFSSPEVASWRRTIADDAIEHSTVGVVGVRPIHWVNRPTFQQVVQIGLRAE